MAEPAKINILVLDKAGRGRTLRVAGETIGGVEMLDLRLMERLSATAPDVLLPTKDGLRFRASALSEVISALQAMQQRLAAAVFSGGTA
jgi:hypothetical protein